MMNTLPTGSKKIMELHDSRAPLTILVGGGARSGKSRYALELALQLSPKPAYLATAEARDEEMAKRIERHRQERPVQVTVVEQPIDLPGTIVELAANHRVVLIDCLTLWLSNLMERAPHELDRYVAELIETVKRKPATLIFVTNEVGCGIVPGNPLARAFRDRLGELNQRLAAIADVVYWMVFGCPLCVKSPAAS